ncbi:MAG: AmmeMemoRadiSam system protein B, partial [Nitrosopumilaceae archaeon]
THYEPNDFAHEQDMALIEPILEMDVEKFYDVLRKRKVTACGYGAIASTMIACKELGATKGELLRYATSGDVMGDTSSVVGYGSIIFT